MTVKEAIRELEYDKELYNTDAQGKPLDLELLEGTPDGVLVDALDMAIEALQKQIPMKPVVWCGTVRTERKYYCPMCQIIVGMNEVRLVSKYCHICGQALNWEESE